MTGVRTRTPCLTCPLLQQLGRGVCCCLGRICRYFLQRICRKEQEHTEVSPACRKSLFLQRETLATEFPDGDTLCRVGTLSG